MANTRNRYRSGYGGSGVVSDAVVNAQDSLTYDPNPVPEDYDDLRRYINDELFKIRDSLYDIFDRGAAVSDFMLSVAKGDVPGHSSINKFGRNISVAATSTETIYDWSNLYTFPTTADITHIYGNIGDTQVIEVQGLDTNYDLVTQNATLNGTTLVALGTALRRVFRMRVISSTAPSGDVLITNAGSSVAYGAIASGSNQTQMAIYTVPAGYTAYMTNYYGSVNKEASKDPEGVFKLWVRDNANVYVPQIKHTLGVDADGTTSFTHGFEPYFKVTEKSDIWINFSNIAATTGDVSAGFDLILVEDGY